MEKKSTVIHSCALGKNRTCTGLIKTEKSYPLDHEGGYSFITDIRTICCR